VSGALDRTPVTRTEKFALAFLKHAPQRIVEIAASLLARGKALESEPGWYFDIAATDPSMLTRIKRDLWEYYRDRGITRPVRLRWYDGLRIRVFLGNDMSLCLFVGGSFEPNEFVFLDAVLADGMTFIDGGANDGIYSLFAAKRVGGSGTVLAVEPSSREFDRLRANLMLNRQLAVTAVRAALGSAEGEADLAVAERGHEGQNTIGASVSNPKVQTAGYETVPVTTVDALVEAHRLDRVDVVKLDVEGSEVEALLGAARTIERFRPLIQVEMESERLASQGRTKDDLRALLAAASYDLYIFDSETGGLRAAREPDEPEGNAIAAPRGWQPPPA
jgi:FkbM family methyltransferase